VPVSLQPAEGPPATGVQPSVSASASIVWSHCLLPTTILFAHIIYKSFILAHFLFRSPSTLFQMHTHTGLNLEEPIGSSSSPRNTTPSNTANSARPQSRQPLHQPITPPATQQTQPPVQQSRPAIQQPTQNLPSIPPPAAPITPAGGERHTARGPQATRPAAGGTDPVNSETAPPTAGHNPLSQADEIQALKARLEHYEKDGTPLADMHQPRVLFADQETIDRVKAASAPSKDDGKKFVLPDAVPGFKASSLDVGKSPILSRAPYGVRSNNWSLLFSHCEQGSSHG
jgi:hypothetical protein